jgi:uncharacterized membrane protein YdbT with pleckstrin-like domain
METPEWLTLDSDETVVWTDQPRGRAIASTLVSALVWSGLVLAFAYAFVEVFPGMLDRSEIAPSRFVWLAAWAVVALWVVYVPVKYVARSRVRYALTDENVYARTGLLSTAVTRVGVADVRNTTIRRGMFGTLLEYGGVEVSAGPAGTDLQLVGLEAPGRFRRTFQEVKEDEGTAVETLSDVEADRKPVDDSSQSPDGADVQ